MESPPEITQILQQFDADNTQAPADLFPLVYEHLRREAAQQMALERADHTLQPTALVHDAYLRVAREGNDQQWDSRAHFYSTAARAMRRILIDHARSKARLKRGGDRARVDLTEFPDNDQPIGPDQLLELDDALSKLEQTDEQVAELVRLRLYAGLSVTDAAKTMKISRTVAYENWDYALSWFSLELAER